MSTLTAQQIADRTGVTVEYAQTALDELAAHIARGEAEQAERDAAETLRQQMFNLTDAIIAWNQDAMAYLYTAGASGAFDPSAFMVLLQQAEGLLLTYKALPVKTEAVTEQRDYMLQRGQQAQSILALAGLPQT